MLFTPFRKLEEHKQGFESYQEAFSALVYSDGISAQVKIIANNIQDIHNSIRVTMPENMLSDVTSLIEEELDEDAQNNETSAQEQMAQLMAAIATTLAETNLDNDLAQPATNITPNFLNSTENVPSMVLEDRRSTHDESVNNADTLCYEMIPPSRDGRTRTTTENHYGAQLNKITVTGLNTLVYRTLVVPENENRINQTSNATGSVDSIIQWCKNDNLDRNQQVAVEIMVATYVLTFHENAEGDEVLQETEGLKRLARQCPNTNERLRMFITGPAGAGKCKWKTLHSRDAAQCASRIAHCAFRIACIFCFLTKLNFSQNSGNVVGILQSI